MSGRVLGKGAIGLRQDRRRREGTRPRPAEKIAAARAGRDQLTFAGATAARIGEVSDCWVHDIDTTTWTWNVRRQTTPSPGGLVDKATKGKRARLVPLIEEVRPMIAELVARSSLTDGRLFVGPRSGRITTAMRRDARDARDATHWDEVVESIGLGYLRRHDLRHTGLT
ncbi:tyrosine-type recombinase/integrase [Actinomycetospora succinea]|uniref:tyrosine-type recombinase/integrase n=1 Tax=Actinomycetospora succinea TaxID=663603 RepID=UPI001FB6FBDA|nr:tyrosine-type recombinase/integrase [Actinomycetospora succinea]